MLYQKLSKKAISLENKTSSLNFLNLPSKEIHRVDKIKIQIKWEVLISSKTAIKWKNSTTKSFNNKVAASCSKM